ncbi:2-oxoglutarate-Fe(II) type oxidoreductase hxnY-like [Camellia sinensis]|uniref:2-oxoglutarate-Fe(II) type oxidoreductase hxnY-like n=1 Tax=Camellia sinensis TaxID=4442 RepID=UPI001036E042|nr:2-oxoglutarate-Fe(II) type oxidoreductase hxnY-like [Camellia sinensis]
MDEVFYQSKSFFDLPVSEKMKVLRNKKHRGYTSLFNERLDPVNQIHGYYKEGYYIRIEVPENDPDIEKLLYGPNVWPPSDILPGWRETMEKYHREALEVAKAISRIIALALNLEVDFFDRQEMLGKPIATLRLLHYEGRVFDSMKWEFVAPLKGAFVVNLGDMLERWSNCIFRSTLHRVLGNGHERYSVRPL